MDKRRLVLILLIISLLLILMVNSCYLIDPRSNLAYNRIMDARWINKHEVIVAITMKENGEEYSFGSIMKVNWESRSITKYYDQFYYLQRMMICNGNIYLSTFDFLYKLDTLKNDCEIVDELDGCYINISPDSSYVSYYSWDPDTSFVIIETATNEIHTCISRADPSKMFDFDWDNKRVYWFGKNADSYYNFENDTVVPCNISGYTDYKIYGDEQCHSIVYEDSIQLWGGIYESDQVITIYAPYTDTNNYAISPCDRWYSNEDGDYIYPFISNNTIEFYSKSGILIDTLKLKI